jgi:FdhE protein
LEKLKDRIERLKKNRPGYGEVLDFYLKIREDQERVKGSLRMESISLKKGWKDLLTQEGFPLLQRQDFPLDVEACINLFQSLCRIAENANPFMSEQVREIEKAIAGRKLNLKELLGQGLKDKKIEEMAKELGLDEKVFLFLIQNSAKPSIEAGMMQVSKELESDPWLKGTCPICGSLPSLALLSEEAGKRSLLCSFCGHQWRIDRFLCPFCNNKEQGSFRYLYGEGEESYRIDICEKCRQYIKTIDLRKTEGPDPSLEDLATLHLDILALQKGYKKPVTTLWADL